MSIPRIEISGYLVQAKLAQALTLLVGEDHWLGEEVLVEGTKNRWDMVYEMNGARVAVEFDGDEHYRHSLKIKADRKKDQVAREYGYRVVRFPYWLQLTSATLRHYFALDAEVIQDFPHGFITTRFFPASFCELGLERFQREFESLPKDVCSAVVQSLKERVIEHGQEYVIPSTLAGILMVK